MSSHLAAALAAAWAAASPASAACPYRVKVAEKPPNSRIENYYVERDDPRPVDDSTCRMMAVVYADFERIRDVAKVPDLKLFFVRESRNYAYFKRSLEGSFVALDFDHLRTFAADVAERRATLSHEVGHAVQPRLAERWALPLDWESIPIEAEADVLGRDILRETGMNQEDVVKAFETWLNCGTPSQRDGRRPGAPASHPTISDRVLNLRLAYRADALMAADGRHADNALQRDSSPVFQPNHSSFAFNRRGLLDARFWIPQEISASAPADTVDGPGLDARAWRAAVVAAANEIISSGREFRFIHPGTPEELEREAIALARYRR